MWTINDLVRNFFTHKDFLPAPEFLPGTLFTPLHFLVAACYLTAVILLCRHFYKKSETTRKDVFLVLWITVVVLEIVKDVWETYNGVQFGFDWLGNLPLYPCSVYLFAMPFAIWGKGKVRFAACGYVCTLALLGAAINFVYPANVLDRYSCISWAGFHTLFYHSVLLLTALLMITSGYHSYKGVTKAYQLLLPSVPMLIISVGANFTNFLIGSDYMFFRLNSLFFVPLGEATPDWLGVVLVYIVYLFLQAIAYLPSYIAFRKKEKKQNKVCA